MIELAINESLVSYCGLYCGACKRYNSGGCPGCAKNEKATWCKTRTCNIEKGYRSCADCSLSNLRECGKLHNFISKAFGMVFNTDRIAGLTLIREQGYGAFAQQMASAKQMSVKRRK